MIIHGFVGLWWVLKCVCSADSLVDSTTSKLVQVAFVKGVFYNYIGTFYSYVTKETPECSLADAVIAHTLTSVTVTLRTVNYL